MDLRYKSSHRVAIALGVENRLSLLKGLESDKNNSMSINSKYLVDESFEEALGIC